MSGSVILGGFSGERVPRVSASEVGLWGWPQAVGRPVYKSRLYGKAAPWSCCLVQVFQDNAGIGPYRRDLYIETS